jgi:cell wall assembly regulator SMI1
MARLMTWHRRQRWQARRRRFYVDYFLGYFPTQEEAEEAERRFDEVYPPAVRNKAAYRR